MLTGNAWKSIDDVRHEIGDYPGLCFDYLAVTNAVKREWKDTLLNDNIGNIESEQYNADKISETAQNIFNIQIKKLEAFSSIVKTQQFVVSDFRKENTTLIYRTTL